MVKYTEMSKEDILLVGKREKLKSKCREKYEKVIK